MLSKLNPDIIECYQRAEECARTARRECDTRLRQDFLDMERRWLFLARSYEFTDRLNSISNELDVRKNPRK